MVEQDGWLSYLAILPIIIILGLQLYLGSLGIEHELGRFWAICAVALVFVGFPLPLVIGAYFGVVNVLHYQWYIGILVVVLGTPMAFGLMIWIIEVFGSLTKKMRN